MGVCSGRLRKRGVRNGHIQKWALIGAAAQPEKGGGVLGAGQVKRGGGTLYRGIYLYWTYM